VEESRTLQSAHDPNPWKIAAQSHFAHLKEEDPPHLRPLRTAPVQRAFDRPAEDAHALERTSLCSRSVSVPVGLMIQEVIRRGLGTSARTGSAVPARRDATWRRTVLRSSPRRRAIALIVKRPPPAPEAVAEMPAHS
jgi:hypothetical protein